MLQPLASRLSRQQNHSSMPARLTPSRNTRTRFLCHTTLEHAFSATQHSNTLSLLHKTRTRFLCPPKTTKPCARQDTRTSPDTDRRPSPERARGGGLEPARLPPLQANATTRRRPPLAYDAATPNPCSLYLLLQTTAVWAARHNNKPRA